MGLRETAPEFSKAVHWVNVPKPPQLEDLRGRVVLVHFWNASNIHCLHLAPELRQLENKYAESLSVIGVHTPHFDAERQSDVVLGAVSRLYFRHPVANDFNFEIWQQYQVEAWPTVAVIDTEGGFVGLISGDGRQDELDQMIGRLLDDASLNDTRVYRTDPPVARAEPRKPLLAPGKLLVTASGLFVADSGHNRILECSHDGRIRRQIGSGNAGYLDGKDGEAAFNDPQGMALGKDMLYIADRGNHTIRRLRLITGEVETLAGTGRHGKPPPQEFEQPRTVELNSPWDLALSADRLYIAMAGQNQIWVYDLVGNRLRWFAGSGQYGRQDGEAELAHFARPTGLSVAEQMLYVADADASAIRALRSDGKTSTLVGAGPYDFGDQDGLPAQARLQGAMGISLDAGRQILWVMDSYNNRLKAVSLRGGGVKTINLSYPLRQPADVVVLPGKLWIANTGAHEVVQVDTASGQARRLPIGE